MSDLFFNGCESWMSEEEVDNKDDNQLDVHQATGEKIATVEEQAEHVLTVEAEAESAADSVAKIDAEMRAYDHIFEKYAELDRMIAYIKNYGIDQGFLSLCNRNNILGQSFGIKFAALESYDLKGNPNSPEAIAALESLGGAAIKVWGFITRLIARCADWLNRIFSFFDLRAHLLLKRVKDLRKKVISISDLKSAADSEDNPDVKLHAAGDLRTTLTTMTAVTKKEVDNLFTTTKEAINRANMHPDDRDSALSDLKDLQDSEMRSRETEGYSTYRTLSAPDRELKTIESGDFFTNLDVAEDAIAVWKKNFNRLSDIRKQITSLRVKKYDNPNQAETLKASIKECSHDILRIQDRFKIIFQIAKAAVTAASTIAKARLIRQSPATSFNSSHTSTSPALSYSGTESFLIVGLEDASFRDGLMKDWTTARRWFQSMLQNAKSYENPLKEVKSKISKLKKLPDETFTGYTAQSLKAWIAMKPHKLLVDLDKLIKDMPNWSTKDRWGDTDAARNTEKMIDALEKAEPSKVSINLSSMSPSELLKLIDYSLEACKVVEHLNQTYWGGWDLSTHGAAFGTEIVRVLRRCLRNMNFITDVEMTIVKSVLNMSHKAI